MILVTARKYSFRERAPEWILSIGLLIWGVSLALHPGLFEAVGYYRPLLNIMSQQGWVVATMGIALFRLISLSINGLWRPTTHMRAIGAIGGVTIWSSLFIISLLNQNARATGVGTFGMLLAFDFLALWWAAGDAKVVDQLARKQRGINGR